MKTFGAGEWRVYRGNGGQHAYRKNHRMFQPRESSPHRVFPVTTSGIETKFSAVTWNQSNAAGPSLCTLLHSSAPPMLCAWSCPLLRTCRSLTSSAPTLPATPIQPPLSKTLLTLLRFPSELTLTSVSQGSLPQVHPKPTSSPPHRSASLSLRSPTPPAAAILSGDSAYTGKTQYPNYLINSDLLSYHSLAHPLDLVLFRSSFQSSYLAPNFQPVLVPLC